MLVDDVDQRAQAAEVCPVERENNPVKLIQLRLVFLFGHRA